MIEWLGWKGVGDQESVVGVVLGCAPPGGQGADARSWQGSAGCSNAHLLLQFHVRTHPACTAPGGTEHADTLHYRGPLHLPVGDTRAGETP